MIGTTASCPLRNERALRLLNLMNKIIGGVLRRHSRIHESDQVRERVVAEKEVHPCLVILVAINRIQPVRQHPNSDNRIRRARSESPGCVRARLRRSPSTALRAAGDRQDFCGDAALRRPHALRPQSKHFFVQIQSTLQLLASILGMPIAILRQAAAPATKPLPISVSHTSGRMG